jgi:hypothetical protein
MNEKTISIICLVITLVGMLALVLTYKNEFEETTISNLLSQPNSKGILFGRIEHIIQNYPTTLFVLNDGTEATIYYPKKSTFQPGSFVEVYAENQVKDENTISNSKTKKQIELFAQKVIVK